MLYAVIQMKKEFPIEDAGKLVIYIPLRDGLFLTAGSLTELTSVNTNRLSPLFLSTE